jgi:hypothetical protein
MTTEILCDSGTGNSLWAARQLAAELGDGRLQEMFSVGRVLAAYTVQRRIRRLRTDFLRLWLAPERAGR